MYTVLLYTHPHTHTSAAISASCSLSFAFVSILFLNSAVYTPLATTFTALFCLRYHLEINSFFSYSFIPLEVSRELPQRLTSLFSCAVLTLFALTFVCVSHSSLQLIFVLFQTCHTFINSSFFLPYSGFQFLFFLERVPIKPLDFANLSQTCKHVSWWFDLPCHCSSNCSG
jgi:hypothetical protein